MARVVPWSTAMADRALASVNPAAGERHAEEGDLAECVRLLTAAGFEIDRRETGADGPTSADLAKVAVGEGFPVVIVAGGGGAVAPAAAALLEAKKAPGVLPVGRYMDIPNSLGEPPQPHGAAPGLPEQQSTRPGVG